jgi:hypothetical protein
METVRAYAEVVPAAPVPSTGGGSTSQAANDYLTNLAVNLGSCFTAEAGYGVGLGANVHATSLMATGLGASQSQRWGFDGGQWVGRKGFSTNSGTETHVGLPILPIANFFGQPAGPGISEYFVTDRVTRGYSKGPGKQKGGAMYSSGSILLYDSYMFREHGNNHRQLIDALDVDMGMTVLPLSVRLGVSPGRLANFALGIVGLNFAPTNQ